MTTALVLIGGIGTFLYGLRIMSSGLQKVAGDRLRAILGGLTRNRFSGVFSGFLITCAIQSSSATTVLVVSFANAGLLSLFQCMGLIMGANIGTTVTGWLVALLGFKIQITAFALPVIGIGFPLSLINSDRAKQISEVLVGFGLLFLGLKFLKDGVPDIGAHPEALAWVQDLTQYGFGSTLLFILLGTGLTVVVQSSSATMAITLTMAAKGWIAYEDAAAMVLGENLGTTITATLASIGANRNAKRAAFFHSTFNIIGVLWIVPLMPWVLGLIEDNLHANIATRLAAFHTIFNVTNTFLLVWFAPQLENFVLWAFPRRAAETGEETHLRFLETGLLSTPELATHEARRALKQMVAVCGEAFAKLIEVYGSPEKKLGPVIEEIKSLEVQTDEMEEEIVDFCSQLARAGSSPRVGRDVAVYLELANDIERIGDHCMNLVLLAERRYEKGYAIPDSTRAELDDMAAAVKEFLERTEAILGSTTPSSLAEVKPLEARINKIRNKSRKTHAKRIQAGEMEVREGLIFLDMLTNMEKIGDYCWNVCSAITQSDQRPPTN